MWVYTQEPQSKCKQFQVCVCVSIYIYLILLFESRDFATGQSEKELKRNLKASARKHLVPLNSALPETLSPSPPPLPLTRDCPKLRLGAGGVRMREGMLRAAMSAARSLPGQQAGGVASARLCPRLLLSDPLRRQLHPLPQRSCPRPAPNPRGGHSGVRLRPPNSSHV